MPLLSNPIRSALLDAPRYLFDEHIGNDGISI